MKNIDPIQKFDLSHDDDDHLRFMMKVEENTMIYNRLNRIEEKLDKLKDVKSDHHKNNEVLVKILQSVSKISNVLSTSE